METSFKNLAQKILQLTLQNWQLLRNRESQGQLEFLIFGVRKLGGGIPRSISHLALHNNFLLSFEELTSLLKSIVLLSGKISK